MILLIRCAYYVEQLTCKSFTITESIFKRHSCPIDSLQPVQRLFAFAYGALQNNVIVVITVIYFIIIYYF